MKQHLRGAITGASSEAPVSFSLPMKLRLQIWKIEIVVTEVHDV
jgi:hypothetical protein